MSKINRAVTVWLEDAEEKFAPGELPQLGIATVADRAFITIARQVREGAEITYRVESELSFCLLTLLKAIAAATDASHWQQMIAMVQMPATTTNHTTKDSQ